MDAIWDRDAFSAVNVEDQERYANQLFRLLKKGGAILMDTPLYDADEYQGDPHPVNDEDFEKCFGGGGGGVGGGLIKEMEAEATNGPVEAKGTDGPMESKARFEVKLLEVVEVEETWPQEYGMTSYIKRIHLLKKT